MTASEPAVLLMALSLFAVSASASPSARYDDLVSLFKDWRAFQKPRVIAGVPDYSAAAMAAQQKELEAYRRRLASLDPGAWTIPQQVDYQIVKAEMNGLDFDHRVLKPWANNPSFYVTVFSEESDQPAREGPYALGAVELWKYALPPSAKNAAEIAPGIRAIPGLLEQAKANLTGSGRDLWIFGAKAVRQQSTELAALAGKLGAGAASLMADVERARKATDEFAAWLDAKAPSKTGPSGVGVENYDWYLKHVQLVPYTWREEVALMERELARAQALLAMEELRNAKLPPQSVVSNAEEFGRRFSAGVTDYMAFLRDHEILTVKDYMDPALRARVGSFSPPPREFFTEVDYRDPEVMRTHGYHWFDKAIQAHEKPASPIRAEVLLYNMFNTRTEGHATGWEELMMQAGMFDKEPRSRELVYILVAERAARALGELFLQSNQKTLEEASAYACAHTPRGWLSMDGQLVRSEQHLYLQQPGYGTSYLIGKIEIEKLLDDRRRQLGDSFRMRGFMDDFNSRGLIPAALLRWEMTGEPSPELQRMLK